MPVDSNKWTARIKRILGGQSLHPPFRRAIKRGDVEKLLEEAYNEGVIEGRRLLATMQSALGADLERAHKERITLKEARELVLKQAEFVRRKELEQYRREAEANNQTAGSFPGPATNTIPIKVRRLKELESPEAERRVKLPTYAHDGDSGFDLRADVWMPINIGPGQQQAIPTGLAFEIPEGFEGQVRGRSGLAFKEQIGVTHGLGTIDSNYRGEVMVLLRNFGSTSFQVEPQARIAQMVIVPIVKAHIVEVETLTSTDRGDNGFGSTGQK